MVASGGSSERTFLTTTVSLPNLFLAAIFIVAKIPRSRGNKIVKLPSSSSFINLSLIVNSEPGSVFPSIEIVSALTEILSEG